MTEQQETNCPHCRRRSVAYVLPGEDLEVLALDQPGAGSPPRLRRVRVAGDGVRTVGHYVHDVRVSIPGIL